MAVDRLLIDAAARPFPAVGRQEVVLVEAILLAAADARIAREGMDEDHRAEQIDVVAQWLAVLIDARIEAATAPLRERIRALEGGRE